MTGIPKPAWEDLRADLAAMHAAALRAADPAAAVRRVLSLDGEGLRTSERVYPLGPGSRVFVVALGKASIAMARAAWQIVGDGLAGGIVAHPAGLDPGPGAPPALRFFPASHPFPDSGSLAAGDAALTLVRTAAADDVVLALISGGGSALFESLRKGVSLGDLQAITRELQRAGADIVELNTVRRALSRVKGGGLARAASPARVLALLLSDVMGDSPDAIASGPTVASSTSPADARAILKRRGLEERFPGLAEALEEAGAATGTSDAPHSDVVLVGSNRMAAEAVRSEAASRGFHTAVVSTYLQGEAREAGKIVGGMARTVREQGVPVRVPACLILGGETTVTVRGRGLGGRNQELALGAALALEGCPRTAVLSFATDGVDGPTDAAGALATGETLARAREKGLSPHQALEENDAWTFFRALDGLWTSGPTGTNVNDIAVALVYP